jgi:hypothetical protein
MIKKIFRAFHGLVLLPFCVKKFEPAKVFANKRIAIVGAASSALQQKNGDYIDGFDIVIRVNKALVTWNPDNEVYLGKRCDILFHSFFENDHSGGGTLDFDLFDARNVRYVVNPINNFEGVRLNFNFYKKYRIAKATYLLAKASYRSLQEPFGRLRPTIGYSALQTVLSSPFREVFITGFTFFKTPYGAGYRDALLDVDANKKYIQSQNIHDPDLEFRLFISLLKNIDRSAVIMDETLGAIVKSHE